MTPPKRTAPVGLRAPQQTGRHSVKEKEEIAIAEFEDRLNALLSDPNAMGQIMSLANSLGSETQQDEGAPSSSEGEGGHAEAPDLSALLSSVLGGMDPKMVQMLLRLVSEYGAGLEEKNVALLTALRPFLKEKRQAKMDRAMQLAKFSRVARVAFQLLKGGDEPV